jgi:hypothetical protein
MELEAGHVVLTYRDYLRLPAGLQEARRIFRQVRIEKAKRELTK